MAERKRIQFQIDTSKEVRKRARTVAIERDVTLTVLVLQALTQIGDEKLTKLIKEYLEERPQKGRPQKDT